MEYCKLQIGCLIVLIYIGVTYIRDSRKYRHELKAGFFDEMLLVTILTVAADGATAYTVNHLDTVPALLNTALHAVFFIGMDLVMLLLFLYVLRITGNGPRNRESRWLLFAPFLITAAVIVGSIGELEYRVGEGTNYSKGLATDACFAMAAIYVLITGVVFLQSWRHIDKNKREGILTYLAVLVLAAVLQLCYPEILMTSIAMTMFMINTYTNMEDPALRELTYFHEETVMSFANLIENRDDNTGGHIKRTSRYVELIAEGLRQKGYYRTELTPDYVKNLIKAAPMHDVGKISVPDSILRKPGRLTEEEYTVMKRHAADGGEIVKEIFRNLGDEEYLAVAYDVARHHHEKWNGRGYPDGLAGEQIPLSARIMAVADVFDAVSEWRCYRGAMPMEECFHIIEKGSGEDFDPKIVEVFLANREQVETVHRLIGGREQRTEMCSVG